MQIKELPPMEVLQQCRYRRGKWIKCVLPTCLYADRSCEGDACSLNL